MLHIQTVSPELLALVKQLMQDEKLNDFRLVGGTALALQIGHRKSVDIDLFSNKPFDAGSVRAHIDSNYPNAYSGHGYNTVTAQINDININLVAHQYPWLKPAVVEDGIRMASVEDIAAMKINAIHGIGNRPKDFADIYVLLNKMPLKDILQAHQQKYPETLPSLVKDSVRTFGQMNKAQEIKLIDKSVQWVEIKKRLKEAVKNPEKIFKKDIVSLLPKKRNNSNGHKQRPKL